MEARWKPGQSERKREDEREREREQRDDEKKTMDQRGREQKTSHTFHAESSCRRLTQVLVQDSSRSCAEMIRIRKAHAPFAARDFPTNCSAPGSLPY